MVLCLSASKNHRGNDKTMPIGFQLFMFQNCKVNKYSVTNNFSQIVDAKPLNKGLYKIFPRISEVLTVYKNYSAQLMKGTNLEDLKYEFIEIVNVFDN